MNFIFVHAQKRHFRPRGGRVKWVPSDNKSWQLDSEKLKRNKTESVLGGADQSSTSSGPVGTSISGRRSSVNSKSCSIISNKRRLLCNEEIWMPSEERNINHFSSFALSDTRESLLAPLLLTANVFSLSRQFGDLNANDVLTRHFLLISIVDDSTRGPHQLPSARRWSDTSRRPGVPQKALLISKRRMDTQSSRLFYSLSVLRHFTSTWVHQRAIFALQDARHVFLYFSAAHCTVPYTVAFCCHGDFLFHSSIKVISSVVAARSPVKNGHLIVFGVSRSRSASEWAKEKKINSISFRRSSSWLDSFFGGGRAGMVVARFLSSGKFWSISD